MAELAQVIEQIEAIKAAIVAMGKEKFLSQSNDGFISLDTTAIKNLPTLSDS